MATIQQAMMCAGKLTTFQTKGDDHVVEITLAFKKEHKKEAGDFYSLLFDIVTVDDIGKNLQKKKIIQDMMKAYFGSVKIK